MQTEAARKSSTAAGLVPAAGFFTLLRQRKLCARLSNGQTLLAASLELSCARLEQVCVV